MIEYHGWLSIWESPDGENEQNITTIISEIDHLFKHALATNEYYHITGLNYLNVLHFAGSHNRNRGTFDRYLNLFIRMGELAPGSYGLLYFWDDESKEYSNEFRVYRMAKGNVTEKKDLFLSPCNPIIDE